MRPEEDAKADTAQDGRGMSATQHHCDIHDYVQVRHVLVERDILTATKTPWLVRLLYAFQDSQHVYLAMEYVPGGDFWGA